MTDHKSTFPERLGQLVRMLSASNDGEALSTARSLGRILKSNNRDFNWLAETVEHHNTNHNGKALSEAEMRQLYDAGFADGFRIAEEKLHGSLDFRGIDECDLDWHEIALWVQKRDERLSDREREFVDSVAGQTVYREASEKQQKWLKSIFLRLGGRL
jgi:hypothetical protein